MSAMFKTPSGSWIGIAVWVGMMSATRRAAASDSGGLLIPEQAAYDVTFYDLNLAVNVQSRTIQGVLSVTARIVEPLRWFVLDLDGALEASRAVRIFNGGAESELLFERRGSRIWIDLGAAPTAGQLLWLAVSYGGPPHEAEAPPWGDC